MSRILLLFLLLIPGVYLSAQTITAVSVTGLKRTKPHVAEYPLQKFIGREGMSVDFNDVHAAILDTGILEPLSIGVGRRADGDGMILTVQVREKWAFLPLPLFKTDFDTVWSAGLGIMDNNAFGLNDKFVLAGAYGNTAWFATAMYQYTPERNHFPGWNVMGRYGRENERDTDQHKRILRKFEQDTITGGLGIQYPVTDLLTVSAAFSLQQRIIRKRDDSPNDPGEGTLAGRITPSLELRRSNWDGYLLRERRAKLDYTLTLPDMHPFHTVSLRGVYEMSILPGFKAGLRGGIRYSPDAPPIFESPASSVIIDILPGTFSAQHYAGAALGLEKFIYKISKVPKVLGPLQGTIAIFASYQTVYSYGPLLEHQFDHGISGALNLYLSRVAIPTIGIGVFYNVAKNEFMVGYNMGVSF
ncbi:hypothetical protein AGMMS49942_23800 [Spirochaetia bacterium]|nr:hypothetical protein AGMMS49942_23800 [Spirochaetia bacterium]